MNATHEMKLVIGGDLESIRTDGDEAFCRVYGSAKGFHETQSARARAEEIVQRWNNHQSLIDALEAIANGEGYYGAQAKEYKDIARAALVKAKGI